MKITPFIFCGFLLAVTTSCNSSDNTGKSSATSEPSHTVGTTSTENNPTSDETKIDVPAEPVENSAEEKSAENPQNHAFLEPSPPELPEPTQETPAAAQRILTASAPPPSSRTRSSRT